MNKDYPTGSGGPSVLNQGYLASAAWLAGVFWHCAYVRVRALSHLLVPTINKIYNSLIC